MKLLSVCVPTYNRKALLERLIKNVSAEMKGSNGRVELCISDNCSTDGTRELVQAYARRDKNISYSRNASNIGASRNVIASIERAQGKFCWLIGDDDTFEPGAIAHVLGLLRDGAEYVMPAFRLPADAKPKGRVKYTQRIVAKGSDEWRAIAGDVWKTSYLGSHVVRKDLALRTKRAMLDVPGFPHLAMFLRARNSCDSITLVTTPCITQESDGVFPTSEKIALLFMRLLPETLAKAKARRAMTKEEHALALHAVQANLSHRLLPGLIAVYRDSDDRRKGARTALDAYNAHFRGTAEDTALLRAIMSILRHNMVLVPFSFCCKLAFEIGYVRAGNLLRKHKMQSPWSAQRNARKKGMTEIST